MVLGATVGEVKGRHLACAVDHTARRRTKTVNLEHVKSDRCCKILISLIDSWPDSSVSEIAGFQHLKSEARREWPGTASAICFANGRRQRTIAKRGSGTLAEALDRFGGRKSSDGWFGATRVGSS